MYGRKRIQDAWVFGSWLVLFEADGSAKGCRRLLGWCRLVHVPPTEAENNRASAGNQGKGSSPQHRQASQ